jgi:hypothetical protein
MGVFALCTHLPASAARAFTPFRRLGLAPSQESPKPAETGNPTVKVGGRCHRSRLAENAAPFRVLGLAADLGIIHSAMQRAP